MSRTPTMIFTGEFWPGSSGTGLSEGFQKLGWAVQEFDYRYYSNRASNKFPFRAASALARPFADAEYRARILDECRALKPDLFVTIKGTAIDAKLINSIRELNIPTLMYYPDFHFRHKGVHKDSFDGYDLFVTSKSFHVDYLCDILGPGRVCYIPHGYVSKVHKPLIDALGPTDYRADILYAGNHSPFKQSWLESWAKIHDDSNLRIIGSGWQNASSGPLHGSEFSGPLVGVGYAEAIQRAKINIALHFGPDVEGWQDNVSTRTFEIPACKGFMLHVDNDEIRSLFEPGVEIDVFASPEELESKINFYLRKPDLRLRMIERAYARCVPAYSYDLRAADIISASSALL